MQNSILIRESFSKASETYDECSFLQKRIADEFLVRIENLNPASSVLDIGMGTGYLIERIKSKFSQPQIFGLDCASGMLCKARQKKLDCKFIQAQAENLPFKDKIFDLVISNLSYQWVGNLEHALEEARRVLEDRGKFYFTIFLENTLVELRRTITELLSKDNNSSLEPIGFLPNTTFVSELIKKIGFKNATISSKIYVEHYSNLLELLNWLKRIGANRFWSQEFYSGLAARSFIDTITKKYEKQFSDKGKIFATFEVLFVELVK